MSLVQILMVAGANLLPLAMALSAIVLFIWFRRRRACRSAGVAADAPGCTRCLYLVRGWNSPKCPECGRDVRSAGVCIGPRVHLSLKMLAGVCLAACLSITFGSLIGMWLLTSQRSMAAWRLSDPGGAFEIDLRSSNSRQRFPRRDQHKTVLTIVPDQSLGSLVIGFDGGSWRTPEPLPGKTTDAWRQIIVQPGDSPPTIQRIADELARGSTGPANPMLGQQAQWLQQQIIALRSGPPNAAAFTLPTGLFTSSGNGGGSGVGLSRIGNSLVLSLLTVSVPATAIAIWRRHRPGWRPAIDGEWRQAGGTKADAAQQSNA